MEDYQGPYATDVNNVFKTRDVARVRSFLTQHKIDVNACGIRTNAGGWLLATPLVHAIANFDKTVMKCLLEEFAADLNTPCYRTSGGPIALEDYPLFQSCCTPDDPVEAAEFLLDHGAHPFVVPYGMSLLSHNVTALDMLQAAKVRIQTAWAATWALSQHPVWRDMAQQVAQCIMGTPARKFLNESTDQNKKRRTRE
jgi:hypothetical protein